MWVSNILLDFGPGRVVARLPGFRGSEKSINGQADSATSLEREDVCFPIEFGDDMT